jgi:hypothetical protein
MKRPVDPIDIDGLECKHVTLCYAKDNTEDDLLVIKENIHTKDGRVVPNLHFIKNYQRRFYVTREEHRNHATKKEYEDQEYLKEFTTTQGKLVKDVAKALGCAWSHSGLKVLAKSPYLYGADITTPTLLKKEYQNRYPDFVSNNSVAVIDIETDVLLGHERPVFVGLTYRNRAFLGTTREFMQGVVDPKKQLEATARELLGEYFESRKLELEVMICADAGEACYEAIQRAHEWQPDFLTVWNIDFDLPRITQALEESGYDPAQVWSDPRVPERFRFYKYQRGPAQKETASGKTMSLPVAERWHVASCPATFTLIDSMCLYKRIRMAEQNEPSYSLDYQLRKHLGKRKLRVEAADAYTGLAWHEYMQSNQKIAYGAYNLFDCIGVELFDEKVKDLAQTISVQSGASEYAIFKSQPRRLVDQFYFFCLERGKILATACLEMHTELDKLTRSLDDIIVTLPSHLRVASGLNVLKELPEVKSELHLAVADLDIVSSYPFSQVILNISKATTYREVCQIVGFSREVQLIQGIHLTAPHVNAYEIALTLYKAPTFDQLLDDFEANFRLP